MEDGSWAATVRGPHLHTVTRSEGQEGGGGIGVASVALAHPCMAPSLLPAWGGGQRGDRWDGGVGESERSDRDIRHQGMKDRDQTNPSKGRRQGQGGWVQETDNDGVEDPMEWECTTQLSTTPGPTRSLCLPVSCQLSAAPFRPLPRYLDCPVPH